MQNTLIAALAALLLGLASGYGLGHKIAAGECDGEKLTASAVVIEKQGEAIDGGRKAVAGDKVSTVAAGRGEVAMRARQLNQEREYVQSVENRADCARGEQSFGMLVQSIRRANTCADSAGSGGVPDCLRPDTGAGEP